MEASPIDPSMRSALLPWGSSKGTMSTSTDRAASSGIGSGRVPWTAWLPITSSSVSPNTAPAARMA